MTQQTDNSTALARMEIVVFYYRNIFAKRTVAIAEEVAAANGFQFTIPHV